ncbi:MAG: ferrous iron transport protein B [Pseudomonadota bacterium]
MSVTSPIKLVTRDRTPTIALVGNPNTGKTTIFNSLTGLSLQVGNYPGVTVERKVGSLELPSGKVRVIDLPGTYSLAARSPDEMIVTDVLLGQQVGERPVDLIIAILDSSNLERNLYLLSQLREFGLPVVACLNMADIAEEQEVRIDLVELSRRMGIPVVPTQANKKDGIQGLIDAIEVALKTRTPEPPTFCLPLEVMREVEGLTEYVRKMKSPEGRKLSLPEALRTLVDDGGYAELRLVRQYGESFRLLLDTSRQRLSMLGPLSKIEAEARYRWVRSALEASVSAPQTAARTLTDRIDEVVTHRVWGSLSLLVILGVVFQSIYAWAAPLMNGIGALFNELSAWVGRWIPAGPLQSLLTDGVIGGVGSVLAFLPQIAILFGFMAVLEDCGYMSRAAFLTDRLFRFVGLTGRSVIPLISCFACAVPGIMATRVIENRKQRFATILVSPLISCSARLPVYVLFIGAFIPPNRYLGGWIGLQGLVLFAMHLAGVVVAVPTLWLLNRTLLKSPPTPFFMELPSYKWPTRKTVLLRIYSSVREFVGTAGTIILAMTIVVWTLSYFPHPAQIHDRFERARTMANAVNKENLQREENSQYLRQSYFGRLGHFIEPAVAPLGWNWEIGMAAIASFPAREVVISTLGTIYNSETRKTEEEGSLISGLRHAKREDGSPVFTLAVAFSIMVFFALCCQCGATLSTIKRETNSWRWPIVTFVYLTALAYLAALCVYHTARYLGG